MNDKIITTEDFLRVQNNFYVANKIGVDITRTNLDIALHNYLVSELPKDRPSYKVAFVFICVNPLYWQYAPTMVVGAKQMFLPGHKTDFLFWTDIPETKEQITTDLQKALLLKGIPVEDPDMMTKPLMINGAYVDIPNIINGVSELRGKTDIKMFPIEAVEWPYPTLLRYNIFLQQEEILKEYDYIFYCDIDMNFVGIVGDEILGDLMAVQQPMYAVRKEYWPPYEPNPESASYIKRPGKIIDDKGQPRFMPLYYAGGFQGGKSGKFIEAMHACKRLIQQDMNRNYIPIWNDETVWNKYLFENPPDVVLDPGHCYPDGLIEEYFKPMWGRDYIPKLKTLTKWFTTSKEGGEAVSKITNELKSLKK